MIRRRTARRAQGMTEYIIIVGLVAILLITVVKSFSDALKNTYDESRKKIDSEVTQPISGAGQGQ